MVRIDTYLFGYRHLKVSCEDVPKLVNILLKLSISSSVSPDGGFVLRERDYKRFRAYSAGRIRYTSSEILGFTGFVMRLRKRYGLILAFSLFLFVSVWLSGTVWDVRIEGNERLEDAEILEILSESGFEVGDRWRRVDKNAVEADVLSDFPALSWISINRRGTVAYVRVVESENVGMKEEQPPTYSNILATEDAVISEITAKKGVAVVKPGDVVRKGDVLISGVIETESGTYFCRAEGSVKGQCVKTVSVEVPKKSTVKRPLRESLFEIRLKIFDFFINIFKNYGICRDSYDIINDNREYALFGKYKLPITLVKTYRAEYTEQEIEYSESEIVSMAKQKLDTTVRDMLQESDVVRMRSYGEWKSDFYVLSTEIVYYADITEESAIEVS